MPIVVNGTTIPENVANVLNVNGNNITSVVCNGVTVWTQSLFNALWSGSSLNNEAGLETSGSLYRVINNYAAGTAYDVQGAWKNVNTSGVFSGASNADALGIDGGSLFLRAMIVTNGTTYGATNVSFSLATKAFTGSSSAWRDDGDGGYSSGLTTSGGLIRYGWGIATVSFYGSYISLT